MPRILSTYGQEWGMLKKRECANFGMKWDEIDLICASMLFDVEMDSEKDTQDRLQILS